MSRKEEQLHVYIPAHLKERLKSDERTQKEVVTEALEIFYGVANGDEMAAMKHQLEREREELAELERREEKIADRRDEIAERVAELEEKVEQAQESMVSYEESIDEMLEKMIEQGTSIFETHPDVEERSREYDKTPGQVLQDAKEQSNLPEHRFERGGRRQRTERPGRGSSDLESASGGDRL